MFFLLKDKHENKEKKTDKCGTVTQEGHKTVNTAEGKVVEGHLSAGG